MPVIWLPNPVLAQIDEESRQKAPLETGGAFMGYMCGPDYVVTAYIGPGQYAIHKAAAFQPDYNYQEAAIAYFYEASGRRDIYLGDWHSHPADIMPQMSWDDRRVLKQIATHPDARIERPVMAIHTKSTSLGAWCGWAERRWLWPSLRTLQLEVRGF